MRIFPAACLASAFAAVVMVPAIAAERTAVAVTGPKDWAPNPGYSLEIGDVAYSINANNGGGVTGVQLAEPTVVRVRRLPDCQPIVRFIAQPGATYVINFAVDGTPHVEDYTGRPIDSGPGLQPGSRVCAQLPDTATAPALPPLGIESSTLAIPLVAGLAAALLVLHRARRPARLR